VGPIETPKAPRIEAEVAEGRGGGCGAAARKGLGRGLCQTFARSRFDTDDTVERD